MLFFSFLHHYALFSSPSSSSPHGRSGFDDIITWEPAGWGHTRLNTAVCLSVCVLFMHADVMPDVCLYVNDRAALGWLLSSLVVVMFSCFFCCLFVSNFFLCALWKLVYLCSYILFHFFTGDCSIRILFNLSSTFDMVNLIVPYSCWNQISTIWQSVAGGNALTFTTYHTCGVPQSSIWGPLFSI